MVDMFVRVLPKGYLRVDVVADTYKDTSIKGLERKLGGKSEKINIASLESKTPSYFSRILKNGENRARLIELIIHYIETYRIKVLNQVRCTKIVISSYNRCVTITSFGILEEADLQSYQAEADTKLILHCHDKIAIIFNHVALTFWRYRCSCPCTSSPSRIELPPRERHQIKTLSQYSVMHQDILIVCKNLH